MSRIFWDTMLFVYLFEQNPSFEGRIRHILTRMDERGDRLLTSSLAVGEILSGFYKRDAIAEAQAIEDAFASRRIEVIPFTRDCAPQFARIRADLGLPAPDAIHLACAAESNVDLFLTNDRTLVGKVIPGIQFIDSLETRIF